MTLRKLLILDASFAGLVHTALLLTLCVLVAHLMSLYHQREGL